MGGGLPKSGAGVSLIVERLEGPGFILTGAVPKWNCGLITYLASFHVGFLID